MAGSLKKRGQKFIRKSSVDELPQLFNIIKGDMSFIGPRPERPEIIKQYIAEMPEFAFRTKVKAGLAGYAQVYGKYNTTPYDKLKLDLTYIENYTFWMDIKLMLLGIALILCSIAIPGMLFVFMIPGLIFTLIGLFMKGNKNKE